MSKRPRRLLHNASLDESLTTSSDPYIFSNAHSMRYSISAQQSLSRVDEFGFYKGAEEGIRSHAADFIFQSRRRCTQLIKYINSSLT